ncbi:MAG: hypothetical protein U5K79_13550 [Cyclobacteriaceae bacterium]|nr:hypothetical protein [Cyclobacteriaceae bacterium]
MRYFKGAFAIIVMSISISAQAQEVEHNYKVGPQNVSCDSLKVPPGDLPVALDLLKGATYRYSKKFRMTRKNGLQGGEFYSCNGITGFLIVRYDNQEVLYMNFDKTDWESFTSSSDPEGFYIDNHSLWEKSN